MFAGIRPLQYVKEHENDYLLFKGDRFFVHSYYAGGEVEVEKKEFERLENLGYEVR